MLHEVRSEGQKLSGFKPVQRNWPTCSTGVGLGHGAHTVTEGNIAVIWFWIGTDAGYDEL